MKFTNGLPDDIADNLSMLEELGGPKTYNHYPNGWAMAFNTPFKMWKRYEFNGGTADPCIISWPAGMAAKGELREQYHHAVDIVPTILDVLGVEPPERIKGHEQVPFDGVSMRYSFDDAGAPTNRRTQFYSMLGSRGIWHDGWKAVTTHPTLSGWSHFNDDEWELYHTDVDRAELHNLAAEHPEKLRELVNLWFAEAGANGAFPLDDRSALEIILTPRPVLSPPRSRYVYYPDTAEVPESQAVNIRNRSFVIGAHVDLPDPGAEGVLMAQGSRFGGHALYIKDNRLHYGNNFVGLGEQKVDATEDLPTGEDLLLSASFVKDGEDPPHVSTGILSLYYGEKKVGEGADQDAARQVLARRRRAHGGARRRGGRLSGLSGREAVDVHRRNDPSRGRRRQRRAVRRSRARGPGDADAGVGEGCAGSVGLGVGSDAGVQQHAGLVTHDPGVVARFDQHDVPGADRQLGAVVVPHRHLPREAHAGVPGLAALGPGDGLDVLRPAPAGLEDAAAEGEVAQGDDVHVAVSLEGTGLVRGVDVALPLERRGHASSSQLVPRRRQRSTVGRPPTGAKAPAAVVKSGDRGLGDCRESEAAVAVNPGARSAEDDGVGRMAPPRGCVEAVGR